MNRRHFIRNAAVGGAAAALMPHQSIGAYLPVAASRPSRGIADVGSTKQLFLDEQLIHSRSRISGFMYRPDKWPANPILVADKPWEFDENGKGRVVIDGPSVLFDPQDRLFKMWYNTGTLVEGRHSLQYATSRDGLVWTKPSLGLHPFRGSKANNICAVLPGADWCLNNFTHSPDDPDPNARFKAMGEWENDASGRANTNGGACVAFSPDGLNWTIKTGAAIKHGINLADGPQMFGWDAWRRKYVAYPRPGCGLAPEIDGIGVHRHIRTIGYAESDDFISWTPTQIMLAPDAHDRVDFQYGQFVATHCANFYVGFLMVHQTHEQTWGVYLMSSRDGFHWNWVDRNTPFMVRGERGSYDGGFQIMAPPVVHEGRILIYYTGIGAPHSSLSDPRWGEMTGAIALATMPEDRWFGLLAGPDQGVVITRPVTFRGSKLLLDLDASKPQSHPGPALGFDECDVRVALTDQSGGRIDGFTSDRCTPIRHSGRTIVEWPGADLRHLEGRAVRIRFELRAAALYSFQFL